MGSHKKKAKKSKADKKASKAKKKDKNKAKKEDKKEMKEFNKNSMDWNRVGNKKDLYGKWYQPTQNVCNAVSCKNKNAWRKQARAANANCIISWGFVRKKYRGLPGFMRWKGLTRLPAGQHTPQQDNKVFKDFHNATVTWEMEQKKTKAAKAKALIAAAAKAKGGANREEQSSLVLLEEDSLSDKKNKDKKAKKAKKEKKKAKKKDDKKKKKKAKKDANRCKYKGDCPAKFAVDMLEATLCNFKTGKCAQRSVLVNCFAKYLKAGYEKPRNGKTPKQKGWPTGVVHCTKQERTMLTLFKDGW